MAFNYASSGSGWRLAGSLIQLATEVAAAHPGFTCLGTIGDADHVGEGTASDHNPFIKDPTTGLGIVRAIDIGGPDAQLQQLQSYLWGLYAAKFAPLWEFGYVKGTSNNQINNWGLPFGHHEDDGDASHLHVSVTQANGNAPSAAGYVAAIDSRQSWGISSAVAPTGGGTIIPTATGNPIHGMAVPPLIAAGSGQYLGPIHGPAASHGGYYSLIKAGPDERPIIKLWQEFLIWDNDVAGVTNPASSWADGVYDEWADPTNKATSNATAAFQAKHRPGALTTLPGQVWSDDWATAASL